MKYKPYSLKEYSKKAGNKLTIVENETNRVVYEPAFFNKSEGFENNFSSPEIYVAEIKDAYIHGGTGIIISEKLALTDICTNDTENRVLYTSGGIRRGRKKAFYLETAPDYDEIDEAVSLCGLAAGNYYHLTFEILSRYGYIKKYLGDRRIPVLLDEDARKYPQFIELVETFLKDIQVIYVPAYRMVHCKNIIYPSMNTWMPMNVRKKNDFRLSDNMIAYSAVENIRGAVKDLMIEQTDLKIFISRKNMETSRVLNEKEVAELFKNAGYKIVCTEEMSYREQVELFSSATCIVGASGAALTNLVYCKPHTVFGCIIPRKYRFCVYSSIAHMVGCNILNLDAHISQKARAISVEQYKVDLDECCKYIVALEDLKE